MRFILFAAVVAFSSFRWDIGWDFPTYINIINDPLLIEDDRIAPFAKLLLIIGEQSGYYQLSFGLFAIPLLFTSIFESSKQRLFLVQATTFLIGVNNYIPTLTYLRQGLAVGFFLASCFAINKKNYLKCGILFACGVFSHASIVFAYPLYFLVKKLSFKNAVYLIIGCSALILIIVDQKIFVAELMATVFPENIVIQQYISHLGSETYGVSWYFIDFLLLAGLVLINKQRYVLVNDFFIKVSLIGIVLAIMLSQLSADIARVSLYLIAFLPFAYSNGVLVGNSVIRVGLLASKVVTLVVLLYIASLNPVKDPFAPLSLCFSSTNKCISDMGFK